jgi:outer membrane protein assembly factor BamC
MQTPSPFARPHAVTAVALAMALLLGGCSSVGSLFGRDEPDYRGQSGKTQPLEVPPDLSQLARDSRYRTQTGAPVTASGQQAAATTTTAGAAAAGPTVAATSIGNIRVERQGNQRWLVVPAPAEQVWPRLREFWLERGFTLVVDEPAVGILQTNWAENRAKIPQDFIRRTIGRLFESAYSSSERDQFRTRVERVPGGGTEIYITHRGMEEAYTSSQRDNTAWRPRPQDPQIEAEYLSRLMVKLGMREDAARSAVAATSEPPPRARAVTTPATPAAATAAAAASGAVTLEIDEAFDRAWRRVGLALDRSSFTVEDRDRAAGLYFVRWVDPKTLPKDDDSFFSRLLGSGGSAQPQRLRVLVKTEGSKTRVSVLNAQGTPETGDAARSIIAALERELR